MTPTVAVFTAEDPSLTDAIGTPVDPWGIVVVGSPEGIGPLCSEAGRLGFEVFRCRELTTGDRDRLHATDWAAAAVVDDGSDMATTIDMLETYLPPTVPIVWVGEPTQARVPSRATRLPHRCPAERIAATVFDRARAQLYPAELVAEIRGCFRRVMLEWNEPGLTWGPVWVKNHCTPPYSMSVVVDMFGDVSGELAVSASHEWFNSKRDIMTIDLTAHDADSDHTVNRIAIAFGRRLLMEVKAYFESRGADLSTGVPETVIGGRPVIRHVSHRPALCLEFVTRRGELLAVEFAGTGLEALGPTIPKGPGRNHATRDLSSL